MESLLSSFSSTNFYHYRKGEYPRSELSNSMHSKFLNNNKIPIRFLNLSRIRTRMSFEIFIGYRLKMIYIIAR